MINHRHVAASLVKQMIAFFEKEGHKPTVLVTNLDPEKGPRGSMISVTFQADTRFEWEDIICIRDHLDPKMSLWRLQASFWFGATRYEMVFMKKPYYVPVRRVNWFEVAGALPDSAQYRFTTNPE